MEWDSIPQPPLPRAFTQTTAAVADAILMPAPQVPLPIAAAPVQAVPVQAVPVQAVPVQLPYKLANSVFAFGSMPVAPNQTPPVQNVSSQELSAPNECYLSPSALLPAFDEAHELQVR